MKNIVRLLTLALSIGLISGCAQTPYSQKKYTHYAKSIPPIVEPAGVKIVKKEPYYPLPKLPTAAGAAPVSLVPPGSKILQYQRKTKNKKYRASQHTASKFASNKNVETLVIAANKKSTWKNVGQALKAANYQILDQDQIMGSYYVLDTQSTNGKITQATPIYRVQVSANGKQSQLELFNQSNKPANSQATQRILGVIKQNLA